MKFNVGVNTKILRHWMQMWNNKCGNMTQKDTLTVPQIRVLRVRHKKYNNNVLCSLPLPVALPVLISKLFTEIHFPLSFSRSSCALCSILLLFGPCPGHGLFFLQELLHLAAAKTFFFITQFCLQFTLLKFSSRVNFKILSTAISFHAVTVGISTTQHDNEIVHSTFHRPVHPGTFFIF